MNILIGPNLCGSVSHEGPREQGVDLVLSQKPQLLPRVPGGWGCLYGQGRTCCGCSLIFYCPGCAWAAREPSSCPQGTLKELQYLNSQVQRWEYTRCVWAVGKRASSGREGGRCLPRARKERTEREGGEGVQGIVYLRYRGTTRGRVAYNPLPYNQMQIYSWTSNRISKMWWPREAE